MRNKRTICAASILMVGLVCGWWIRQRTVHNQVAEESVANGEQSHAGDQGNAANPAGPSGLPLPVTKGGTMQILLQTHNHKLIQFYGRVIDQNDQPVSGVSVFGEVIYNTGAMGGTANIETATDSAGHFKLTGASGRTLGVGLYKEGYAYGGEHGAFHFTELVSEKERYHPDSSNPVIFHIWRLQGPEQLLEGFKVLSLSHDGRHFHINLRTGKVIQTGGDIIVSMSYKPEENIFDWDAEMRVPGGGLVVTETPFKAMFSAPEAGYSPSFVINMKANSPSWKNNIYRNVYVKTAEGIHAKIEIEFGANRVDPFGVVTVRWRLNPKVGSRVLEPGKTVEIY